MSDTPELPEETEVQPPEQGKTSFAIPLLAAVIQSAAGLVALKTGSTNLHMIAGLVLIPAIMNLVLVVWMFRTRSMTGVERATLIAGILIAVAALAVVHGQQQNGITFVMLVVPVLTSLLVFGWVIASTVVPQSRARVGLVIIVGWAAVCALLRVDSSGGDLMPVTAWRWEPPMETQFDEAATKVTTLAAEPITLPTEPGEGDWAEFRGPHRDGRAVGPVFATNWDEHPPSLLWKRDVGLGWSAFTVIGDYLFTQEQRGDGEFTVCYRADTGEEIWANHVSARFSEAMGGDGPRATPTFSDGKLYSQGATGVLQCIDPTTGETVWSRDVGEDSGAAIPTWGFASSPLVVNGKVVVFTGGGAGQGVVAYSAADGEVVWKSGDGTQGYCSAQLATLSGVDQILLTSDYGMESFDPETGAKLWEHVWPNAAFQRVVQPLLIGDNTVIFGDGATKGSRKLSVFKDGEAWNVTESWTSRRVRPYFNDVVLHEGYIYGYDGNRLVCVSAETGELAWRGDRAGGQLLMLEDMGVVLCLTEEGTVLLIEATPEAQTVLAELDVLEGKTWNHPVVANGRLYVRNAEEAACFELPAT